MSLSTQNLELITSEIENALNSGLRHVIPHWLKDVQPGDVAQIIQYLSPPNRTQLMQVLKSNFNPEILTYLDENVSEEITRLLNPKELASAVAQLDSDDAFSVLEDLNEDQQQAVLYSIAPEERQSFEETLAYPKDSAGRIMQREVVVIPETWTVAQALKHLSHNHNLPEIFYDVFVLNSLKKPVGVLSLTTLMRARPQEHIKTLMNTDVNAISVTLDQESIALIFKRYTLLSAPVIDDASGQLLGMITLDDVVDIIDREAEEDIMHLGGVSNSDFYAPVFATTLARFQWLLITFVNTLLASAVISHFQLVLEKKVALAILMPIVAAMGGNAGMQVVTVVVRALATKELTILNMPRTIGKSVIVSCFIGLMFAVLLSGIATLWFHDKQLGIILGSAMFLNMLWAGVAGTILPIVVNRFGMDPALSAGPILTTTTDVLGFAIFLGLASMFML